MTEPTDAEILDAAEDFRSQYKHGGTTFDEFDALDFARAVLAKWGTPAPVGVEPVASKSHGAWDGIEDVLDMPNGTDLYTADQALAMGRVPPGWQAVPLEATHEMIMASGPHIATPAIWRAMLAAAPPIKQGGQHGADT